MIFKIILYKKKVQVQVIRFIRSKYNAKNVPLRNYFYLFYYLLV